MLSAKLENRTQKMWLMILKRLFYFIAECLSTFNRGIESYSDRGKSNLMMNKMESFF